MGERKVKVLDSTAIFLGFIERKDEVLVTCREVLDEVRYGKARLIEPSNVLKILKPEEDYVGEVENFAVKLGEHGLSDTDIKVLALALQLKRRGYEVSLVTSDYSIQNVGAFLGLKVEPVLHRGIRKTMRWITYCASCGWRGEAKPGEPCPRCGARLKRRPI